MPTPTAPPNHRQRGQRNARRRQCHQQADQQQQRPCRVGCDLAHREVDAGRRASSAPRSPPTATARSSSAISAVSTPWMIASNVTSLPPIFQCISSIASSKIGSRSVTHSTMPSHTTHDSVRCERAHRQRIGKGDAAAPARTMRMITRLARIGTASRSRPIGITLASSARAASTSASASSGNITPSMAAFADPCAAAGIVPRSISHRARRAARSRPARPAPPARWRASAPPIPGTACHRRA